MRPPGPPGVDDEAVRCLPPYIEEAAAAAGRLLVG
ncbi:hypothetical protein JOF41_001720 [Saccharothrix coeruleofusca]|nr:hypothetical protein [Saccharothrix coeruleofusca]